MKSNKPINMKTKISATPRKVFMSFFIVLIFVLRVFTVSLAQVPGTLDVSFGEQGKVLTSESDAVLHTYSSLLQTDGKIVLAGYSSGFLFVRYLSNGEI